MEVRVGLGSLCATAAYLYAGGKWEKGRENDDAVQGEVMWGNSI